MIQKTAVVVGSTGLVGSRLIELLASALEYSTIIALARRFPATSPARIEWRKADFERLDTVLGDVRGTEANPLDVFCCLGTTIKTAGSQQEFRRVDFDFVVASGRWAAAAGARRMIVVSALGADSKSRVFYNRVKGDAESALSAVGLASLVLLRPSLLDGDRVERRRGERITLAVTRPFRRLFPPSIRPVLDRDVAGSMLAAARSDSPPRLIESAQLHGAATRLLGEPR